MPFIKDPPINKLNQYIKVRIIDDKLKRCCRYCGIYDTEFYHYHSKSRSVEVYTNVCKQCHRERQSISDAKYREANKEKIKEKSRKWEAANKDYRNKYKAELRIKKNPALFKIYKKRKRLAVKTQEVEWHTIVQDGFTKMTYSHLLPRHENTDHLPVKEREIVKPDARKLLHDQTV